MREHVRCLKGTGRIEADDKSIRVEYVINEYEDNIPAGTHQNPSSTARVRTSRDGSLRSAANEHLDFDTPYTLHLKDGKKLKLCITRTDGQSADFKATGAFQF